MKKNFHNEEIDPSRVIPLRAGIIQVDISFTVGLYSPEVHIHYRHEGGEWDILFSGIADDTSRDVIKATVGFMSNLVDSDRCKDKLIDVIHHELGVPNDIT